MLLTAITACHDNLEAVESCEQLFELLNQFLAVQSLMLLAALAAELGDIEVRRKLCGIIEIVGLTHFLSSSMLSIIS